MVGIPGMVQESGVVQEPGRAGPGIGQDHGRLQTPEIVQEPRRYQLYRVLQGT